MEHEEPKTVLKPLGVFETKQTQDVIAHYADSDPGIAELTRRNNRIFFVEAGTSSTTTRTLIQAAQEFFRSPQKDEIESTGDHFR